MHGLLLLWSVHPLLLFLVDSLFDASDTIFVKIVRLAVLHHDGVERCFWVLLPDYSLEELIVQSLHVWGLSLRTQDSSLAAIYVLLTWIRERVGISISSRLREIFHSDSLIIL